MSLVPKEILLLHLQRAEGAEEVTLPIDFFRDLLYQAMPRTWVGLTDDERGQVYKIWRFHPSNETNLHLCKAIEAKLKEKNT